MRKSDSKAESTSISVSERDRRVLSIYDRLQEIEGRLIPTGLHVFGEPGEQRSRVDMLRMLASFDRPELGVKALPDLIAAGLGLPEYSSLVSSPTSISDRETVDNLTADVVRDVCTRDPVAVADTLLTRIHIRTEDSLPVLNLIKKVAGQLESNGETDALIRALRGEFIEPGPGADIVQNPEILPTGRNTHAINPYAVPSITAFTRSETTVNRLLQRHLEEHGQYPRAMALVLWGLDNIKTQGEGVAQALWLLGVRPVRDPMNRVTSVDVIPLEELGHPRIDVVMTVSGIFRDLFASTINLLDHAVRAVAALDEPGEMNYLKRHVAEQRESSGCSFDDAVLRVFSNAPGNYGTNVNFMVMNSQWDDRSALGDLFVKRKCFAYGRDATGRSMEGSENSMALDHALSRVEATYQNIDTFEIGITDVDHYFEYLGGVSKAVEDRAQKRPAIYLSDALTRDARVRSLEEAVELEARTKTLNPRWYEGMLKHGFRGVAEIESHVTNTFGWSATADAVDDWVYTEVAETYILDEAMLKRLTELNVHSVRSLTGRLMEAHSRGFWDAEAGVLDKLRDVFAELEDTIEGVT